MKPHYPGRGHRRRHTLANRDGWECFYCHKELKCHICEPYVRKPQRATLDHRVPKCKGGTLILANVVLACGPCNTRKADLDPDEPIPDAAPRALPAHWYAGCVHSPNRRRRGFPTEDAAMDSVAHIDKPLVAWLCKCGNWHVGKPTEKVGNS